MKDLTQGSIPRQLIAMAVPIAAGMVFQTLYYLVDLYFVAGLGDAALAGVGSAGNITMVIVALTQMLGVGTVALVAHAAGRKDRPEANLIFNQSVLLSAVLGVVTLVAGYALTPLYMRWLASNQATVDAGCAYINWYLPGLALQFALVAMGSALRGTGIVKPTMVVQVVSVVLNTILAPILIAGWGTHHPLGAAGAGLASTLAILVGVVFLWVYFHKLEHYVAIDTAQWRIDPSTWKRILNIGLPAGGEMLMIFIAVAVAYWTIRSFGPAAQAGFGIGSRIMQSIFLPPMAVAFAAAPVAGQNFGARRFDRVRETFWSAAALCVAMMVIVSATCMLESERLIGFFSTDPEVIAVGAPYLRIVSWNFFVTGVTFTCSSLFQALGNTWPSLLSSGVRLITYVPVAVYLGLHAPFNIDHFWYWSVCTITLQGIIAISLLLREFRIRLNPSASPQTTAVS